MAASNQGPAFTKFYVEPGTSKEAARQDAANRLGVSSDDPSLRVFRKKEEDVDRSDGTTAECWTACQRWDLMA